MAALVPIHLPPPPPPPCIVQPAFPTMCGPTYRRPPLPSLINNTPPPPQPKHRHAETIVKYIAMAFTFLGYFFPLMEAAEKLGIRLGLLEPIVTPVRIVGGIGSCPVTEEAEAQPEPPPSTSTSPLTSPPRPLAWWDRWWNLMFNAWWPASWLRRWNANPGS